MDPYSAQAVTAPPPHVCHCKELWDWVPGLSTTPPSSSSASSSLQSSRTSSITSSTVQHPSQYRFIHNSSPGRKAPLDREDKAERRRAQNRLSQQAYRKRKNKRASELEVEVAECSEKYEALSQAHELQSEEIGRLKGYLEGLVGELEGARRQRGQVVGGAAGGRRGEWVEEFDLVPLTEEKRWSGEERLGMRDYFDGYAPEGS